MRELAASGLLVLADKGYAGVSARIRYPYKDRESSPRRRPPTAFHAQLPGPGERANAQLKTWRILRKLRYCPWKAGQLVKAIHVLQTREIGG